MATTSVTDPLHFDAAFAADIANGVEYADAFEKHVTGKNQIRRAACLQTLQALLALTLDEASLILMWAKQQQY